MKKRIAGFLSLVMLIASLGGAHAEADLLEGLLASVDGSNAANDLEMVQEMLATHGYRMEDNDAGDLYDMLLAICEQEYGSYYGWTLSQRYRFDALMVSLEQMPYPVNLDPASDGLEQEQALEAALAEIVERYGVAYRTGDYTAAVSYTAMERGSTQGMWRFGVEFASGDCFAVHVLRGDVVYCAPEKKIGSLEAEYNELCKQRGAFFKWSPEEKMAYANSLPDKLRIAQEKNEINMSYDELAAIAQYGFSLPGNDDLPQEEITPIALQAVQAAYGLSEGWHVHAEIYYSFFTSQIGESRWRVIIWHTGDSAFPSGIVELNARSGEVLRIAKNGTLPNEYIPYLERI